MFKLKIDFSLIYRDFKFAHIYRRRCRILRWLPYYIATFSSFIFSNISPTLTFWLANYLTPVSIATGIWLSLSRSLLAAISFLFYNLLGSALLRQLYNMAYCAFIVSYFLATSSSSCALSSFILTYIYSISLFCTFISLFRSKSILVSYSTESLFPSWAILVPNWLCSCSLNIYSTLLISSG